MIVSHEIESAIAAADQVLALRADGSVAHAGPGLDVDQRPSDRGGQGVRRSEAKPSRAAVEAP